MTAATTQSQPSPAPRERKRRATGGIESHRPVFAPSHFFTKTTRPLKELSYPDGSWGYLPAPSVLSPLYRAGAIFSRRGDRQNPHENAVGKFSNSPDMTCGACFDFSSLTSPRFRGLDEKIRALGKCVGREDGRRQETSCWLTSLWAVLLLVDSQMGQGGAMKDNDQYHDAERS